jgi:hypothetical protein
MSFVGSAIIYAYMQPTGLANDHLVSCFRIFLRKGVTTPLRNSTIIRCEPKAARLLRPEAYLHPSDYFL